MKKYLLLICTMMIILCPSITASANDNVLSMEELSIYVMPEYAYHPNDQKKDHAPLLIGYQGTMVNHSDQAQKGLIEVPLPMKEKNFRIGYVADYSSDLKTTYEIEYIIDREKGTISWTTSEAIAPNDRYKFVVEFYTDGLNVKQEKKSLDYQFTSFADIDLVNISFTVPTDAKMVKLTPAPSEQNHSEGEQTTSYLFNGLKAGEEKSFNLTYERKETKPVIDMSANDNAKGESEKSSKLAIGTFSGVSILAVGALTILIRNRKKQQTK